MRSVRIKSSLLLLCLFIGFTLHAGRTTYYQSFWEGLKDSETAEYIYEEIYQRRNEIKAQKEYWRPKIEEFKRGKEQRFYEELDRVVATGTLEKIEAGCGSTYLLRDDQGAARFIIKPVDEDINCLNNPKEFSNVHNDSATRTRTFIPLYRLAQTDALSYAIAELLGYQHLTPKALMGIVAHDSFFDITELAPQELQDAIVTHSGYPDKEKLCSIQEYCPDTKPLMEKIHQWLKEKMGDEEISKLIDKEDFEDVLCFIWLIYDNDANSGNIHLRPSLISQELLYSMRKFDNALAFPERNAELVNCLSYLPNANDPLPDRIKEKILHLPISAIVEEFTLYEMEPTLDAFFERVEILQELCQRVGLTMAEVDVRMRVLELPDGQQIALSFLTMDELLDLITTMTESRSTTQTTTSYVSLSSHR